MVDNDAALKFSPFAVQLVDGSGNFNTGELERFVEAVELSEKGVSYSVVAIMGPQSSGKSTLMNHLFGTKFVEMDAFKGRSQTTKGIWLSHALDISPFTLVMDMEGTDGRERGEDDTAFEKQSSLFGLATADIVLVNIWCHDIGREHAANKPLLKTVFQVMTHLFSPRKVTLLFIIRDKSRTPLERLEVILHEDMEKIWQSIPKPPILAETPLTDFFTIEVTSLPNYEEKEEQFRLEVQALKTRFREDILNKKAEESDDRVGAQDGGKLRSGSLPANALSFSWENIWRVIKENKDLDLPAHKIMVATVRCEQIVFEKFNDVVECLEWKDISESCRIGKEAISNFGNRFSEMVARSLLGYDLESKYFDEGVQKSKRAMLLSRLGEVALPCFQSVLESSHASVVEKFEKYLLEATGGEQGSAANFGETSRKCLHEVLSEFDRVVEECHVSQFDWSVHSSAERKKLVTELEHCVANLKKEKLKDLVDNAQHSLADVLSAPLSALFDSPSSVETTWQEINELVRREVQKARSDLLEALAGFELEAKEREKFLILLEREGRECVEKRGKEEAGQALSKMKERFNSTFLFDSQNIPRVWNKKANIPEIAKGAKKASLQLLAILSVIRLDEEIFPSTFSANQNAKDNTCQPAIVPPTSSLSHLSSKKGFVTEKGRDVVESLLLTLLEEEASPVDSSSLSPSSSLSSSASLSSSESTIGSEAGEGESSLGSARRLTSLRETSAVLLGPFWQDYPPAQTLLSPSLCKSLWLKFINETQLNVSQALMQQELFRSNSGGWPPMWAILSLVVLGYNEFMALLRNPLLLLIIVALFLFLRALWFQMDLASDFENGLIPGFLALSTKIVPAGLNLFKRLLEEGQERIQKSVTHSPHSPSSLRTRVGNPGSVEMTLFPSVASHPSKTEHEESSGAGAVSSSSLRQRVVSGASSVDST